MAKGIVAGLGANPTGGDIQTAVAQVAELFHALTMEGTRTVQGLWAELFLISQARDPSTVVTAWHEDPLDIFDFALGAHRAEVKSFARLPRRHQFAFEQFDPPPTVKVVVVSILAASTPAGSTVAELVADITNSLTDSPSLVDKLNRIVALSLGADWADASVARFDLDLARRDLAFYFADSVPRLLAPLPDGVSEVRFVADLGGGTRAREHELATCGGLLAALRPRS